MTIKEQLRSNFPKTIKKDSPIFSALVANDRGDAVMESELMSLLEYMREWCGTPNIYDQTGEMLLKSVDFFSYVEKFDDETEDSLKNRVGAVFIRNHDTVWGTPYDVKKVFEQYFPSAAIYFVENTNGISDNLLIDGDFAENSQDWEMTDCDLSTSARFSKSNGVSLTSESVLRQSVRLRNSKNKTYFLHFFMQGKVKTSIKDNLGRYWDCKSETWKAEETFSTYESDEWKNSSLYFFTTPEIESVSISFSGMEISSSSVDYIRLFDKQPYASFTVIAHFEAESAEKALKLAPGTTDPSEEIEDYKDYDYHNQAFVTGAAAGFAQDIYNDLLDMLRAQGVKAYFDIVIKDYVD